MYIIFSFLVLFLIFCATRYVAYRGRVCEVVFQYPPCINELPVVGSLYHFLLKSPEEIMTTIMEAVDTTIKLGRISRLWGLNNYYVVLRDAEDAAEVMKCYLNKDYIYTFLQPLPNQGSVFNRDYAKSKVRRQIFLPSFTPRQLSTYTNAIWRQSVRLTQALEQYVSKGGFHIGHLIGGFCFDSVIGAADVEEIREEFSSVETCVNYLQYFPLVLARWTSLWMQTNFLHRFSSNYRETNRLVELLYTYADKAQEIRRNKLAYFESQKSKYNIKGEKEAEIKPGLFDSLIYSELERREISEEIIVMLGASDEAGLAINFTLSILGLYPLVQDKVYEELKQIFGNSDRPFENEDFIKIHYLDMVIKEVLRLYPPVPFVIRQAHTEIKLSSRIVIPAGVGVLVPIISLHRNPTYWGPDADHFDPERFRPERLAAVPDNAYTPFSCGPRGCPGYKFAQNLIRISLCSILRKFKVVGTPAAGPAPHIRTKYEVTLRPVNDSIELETRC